MWGASAPHFSYKFFSIIFHGSPGLPNREKSGIIFAVELRGGMLRVKMGTLPCEKESAAP